MLKDQIALFLRVAVFYPLAGLLALLPSVDLDKANGLLTVDLTGASVALGAVIWATVSSGTFSWSRWAKRLGGAT